jgi:hypothetical protein
MTRPIDRQAGAADFLAACFHQRRQHEWSLDARRQERVRRSGSFLSDDIAGVGRKRRESKFTTGILGIWRGFGPHCDLVAVLI